MEKYCTAGQATDDNVRVIRRMRYACSMTRAKNTHSEYVIPIVVPRQQWLLEHAEVLRYK